MRLFELFRWGTKTSSNPSARVATGAPFVMTLDGNLRVDTSGRVTDIALSLEEPEKWRVRVGSL